MCQFFARIHAKFNRTISFTERSASLLMAYDWPGNVREISNLMMRFSILFAGEKIDIPTLPPLLLPEGIAELLSDKHACSISSAHPEWFAEIPDTLTVPDLSDIVVEAEEENDIHPLDIENVLRLSNSIGHFPSGGIKAKEFMADIEIRLIKAALSQSNGSVSHAAQLLHMQRTTLIQKIARYNIATAFI